MLEMDREYLVNSEEEEMGSSDSDFSNRSKRRKQSRDRSIKSIPDLRFEQSYLASIRGFIHEEDDRRKDKLFNDVGKKQQRHSSIQEEFERHRSQTEEYVKNQDSDKSKISMTRSTHGEPELWLGRLRIEWLPLCYLTIRDQLLSPIIQGAVFGIAGLAFGQLRSFLIARRSATRQTNRG